MAVTRSGTTVMGHVNNQKNQVRDLAKNHAARLSSVEATAAKTAKTADATKSVVDGMAVTFDTQVVNISGQLNAPTGEPVFGYTGAASLPALNNDSNTGTDWATGERNFINNLNANVAFILAVLRDNNIIGD